MPEHDSPRALVFHPSARSIVYFGSFRLDLGDGLLSRHGAEVRLPPRAMTILQHLVERAGRIVSKQALMDLAWKDAHVSETSLTEAVGLIRQALGDDPQQPTFIQTVHRRGYRFIAPVATDTPLLPTFLGPAPGMREKFIATVPLGRLATAQDIADAALFLASDEAKFLTGNIMEVDGGRCV